jgi:hypothetical protein
MSGRVSRLGRQIDPYIAAYARDVILCLQPLPFNDRFGRLVPEHTMTLKLFEIS